MTYPLPESDSSIHVIQTEGYFAAGGTWKATRNGERFTGYFNGERVGNRTFEGTIDSVSVRQIPAWHVPFYILATKIEEWLS